MTRRPPSELLGHAKQAWVDGCLTSWARAFLGQLGVEMTAALIEIEARRPGGGAEFMARMGQYVARHGLPIVVSTAAELRIQDGGAAIQIEVEEVLS